MRFKNKKFTFTNHFLDYGLGIMDYGFSMLDGVSRSFGFKSTTSIILNS